MVHVDTRWESMSRSVVPEARTRQQVIKIDLGTMGRGAARKYRASREL